MLKFIIPLLFLMLSVNAYTQGKFFGGNGSGNHCAQLLNVSLPVVIISFSGDRGSDGNILKWITSRELNNKGFDIQRSRDGKIFETIGFVEGHGSSDVNQIYTFIDKKDVFGISYYRLKQLDFDNVFNYSEIIVLKNNMKPTISFQPNPGNGIFNLEGQSLDYCPVSLIHFSGRKFYTVIRNNVIDISGWPDGVYLLNYMDNTYKLILAN